MNYKFIKGAFMSLAVLMAVGCDEDVVSNPDATFVQLNDDRSVTILENGGDAVEIDVVLGGPQASDTQVEFDVTGDATRYTLAPSSLSIPAGETSGTIILMAIDDEEINGDLDVVVALSTSSGLPVGIAGQGINSISKTITIVDDNVPCNDYVLIVLTDAFPQETNWEITDADGTIVYSGGDDYGPPSSAESRLKEYTHVVPLEDGCYTFTMLDSYGDGMADGVVEGSWNLTCGAIVAASGAGNFGFSNATEFCVNQ